MQVILLKDVEKVGLRGEVVDVARGYARNFLLPRKLAEAASPGRLEELRRREELRARQEARTHDEAREIAARLEQAVLRYDVKAGPTGSLFGSVTATDVADRLWTEHRIRVDRRKIHLGDPVKRVGRYEVPVEVFTDVTAAVRLEVVPEGGDIAQMEELVAVAEAEDRAAEAEAAAAAEAELPEEEEIELPAAVTAAEAAEADGAVEAVADTPAPEASEAAPADAEDEAALDAPVPAQPEPEPEPEPEPDR
jgi:large subunit ribosomal protein L9